jgi:hypothetical protein
MSNVFISYERGSKSLVGPLADDIKSLGHTRWFDQELSGGQAWWDEILARVRSCDVFVFSMTPAALNSPACQREYRYAADLGKPILPILLADGVSTNLLPPAPSVIQFVDYRKRDDHGSALQLAKALWAIPAPKPLPNPLPSPPAVPESKGPLCYSLLRRLWGGAFICLRSHLAVWRFRCAGSSDRAL